MNDMLVQVGTQLLAQTPMLLVCLVGLILALTLWPRCPPAAALTAGAMALLLLVAVVFPFLQMYLINSRVSSDGSLSQVALLMSILGIGASFLRAAAIGLLLGAVFVGRTRHALLPTHAVPGQSVDRPFEEKVESDTRFRS